jgi:methionine sulfoxide reductase heme-binding subunit
MLRSRWTKLAVFLACLAPFGLLAWRFYRATVLFEPTLGPNPLETLTHFTGDWTIRFIAATLAITPLRKLLRMPDLIKYRRMIGLYAFFYGCLHFTVYLYFDKLFDFHEIVHDVAKRPFITMGFASFVLMVPLALTSTAGWIRRLGGKRWQRLHRLVYLSGVAAVIHYYWLVKSDIRLPLLYGAIIGTLLLYRAAVKIRLQPAQIRPARGVVASGPEA